jgi:hypothetical protein
VRRCRSKKRESERVKDLITRLRLQLTVIGVFLFSLPTVFFIWSDQGSSAAGFLTICLAAFLIGGLLVASRI